MTDTYLYELCDLFVPFLWDIRREGSKVRHTFNCPSSGVWKSLSSSQAGQAFLLDVKD